MVLDITPESVEGMKVQELKDALTSLGLSTKGIKKELAARLWEAIGAPAAPSAEADKEEEEAPAAPEPEPAAPAEEAAPEPAEEPAPPAEEPAPPAEEAAPAADEAAPTEAPPAEMAEGEPATAPPAEGGDGAAVAPEGGDAEASGAEPAAVPPADDEAAREARLVAMRAQVGGLRKQHAELTSLVQQWYQSVVQLQQQQAAAAHRAAAAAAYPPQAGGYGAPGGYPAYPGYPPQPAPAPTQAWSEHYTREGHKYWYNATTGASSWEQPAGFRPGGAGRGGGARAGGDGQPKQKGPPGSNLFVVRKMRRGEFDEFYDQDLREAFERFGTILRAEITLDKETGTSKGFGFVSFDNPQAADAAMAAMNGAMIGGRQIRIEKTAEDH